VRAVGTAKRETDPGDARPRAHVYRSSWPTREELAPCGQRQARTVSSRPVRSAAGPHSQQSARTVSGRPGGPGPSADDLAGLDARGAHLEPLRRPADDRAYGLDVGVPAAPGAAVRVRDLVAETRLLAADVANGSHGIAPLSGWVGQRPARPRDSPGQSSKDIRPARPEANRRRPAALTGPLSTVPRPILPVW